MFTPVIYRKIASHNMPLTPIEQLLADKDFVEAQCSIREKKLQDDFEYIHHNATSLLFSGLTTLLFSSGSTKRKPETQSVALNYDRQPAQSANLLSLSDLFVVAQKMLPVVWEIVQPMLISWGIKKVKSLIFGLFTKKKSAPATN